MTKGSQAGVAESIVHPDREVLVEADRKITDQDAEKIVKVGIRKVKIRSVPTCHSEYGVCSKCYGATWQRAKM